MSKKTQEKTYPGLLANSRTDSRRMIVVVTLRLLPLKKSQTPTNIVVTTA
jgi:hypothetical protein